MEDSINEEEQWAKINKRTLRRIVSKNHTTTAEQVTAELTMYSLRRMI
jgi:hypothetical protein